MKYGCPACVSVRVMGVCVMWVLYTDTAINGWAAVYTNMVMNVWGVVYKGVVYNTRIMSLFGGECCI